MKQRSRPHIEDYGIETTAEGLLDWQFVEDQMRDLKNYWLSTTYPDGRPHSTPVWGSWLEEKFYFGGGPKTRKAKNIRANPQVVVHTESAEFVVIVEGKVEVETDKDLVSRVQEDYQRKYEMLHPAPFWKVVPAKVLAWKFEDDTDFQKTPTRWIFQ